MTMRIEVRINDRLVGEAMASNVSDLADVSDYLWAAVSQASRITGQPALSHKGEIHGHNRRQSAWALVAKLAAEIAEREAKGASE